MKKIKIIGLALGIFLIGMTNIQAASLSVSASAYTVYVGSSVRVSAKASSLAGKFNFKSSNTTVLSGGGNAFIDNTTSSMTFSAKKAGTAKVTVSSPDVADYNGNVFKGSKSVTITVKNREPAKAKSSVNTLKSLSIDGASLNPEFDQSTVDYSVELEADVEKINIKAEAKDSSASISGLGEKNVSEGVNKFEIIVTAENGSKKTYTIKATVKELEPITIQIGNDSYDVIRKSAAMPEVGSYYNSDTMDYNGTTIPVYKGEITGYTLVGLKDSEGNSNLYIYEDSKFTLYREYTFNTLSAYLMDMPKDKLPKGYKESVITLNEEEITAYVNEKDNDYYMVYGMNLETGKESLYQYDKVEGTLQRYSETANSATNTVSKLIKIGLILVLAIVALFSSTIIVITKRLRKINN